ncbi:MAG: arylmalonate decarboxylase [Candidatus Electrothrix sp. AR4]|nr:arylmalonate decarboxylase [Candidatus Electrothrix sp. AR4]
MLNIKFDNGRHWRAKLGFVVLAMEQTIEEDMFRLVPPQVGVHIARAVMTNDITVSTLSAMADGLADASSRILPEENIDVICYACTSGSIVIGENRIKKELLKGAPNAAQATTLVSGVVKALQAVRAERIVVATPYLDEINTLESDYLMEQGFEVLEIKGLNIRQDCDMARVTPDFLFDFVTSLDRSEADAVFVSCGALRSLDIVERLENQLGKPVICSNQAMMWDCLRLAGIEDTIDGYGQLFRLH